VKRAKEGRLGSSGSADIAARVAAQPERRVKELEPENSFLKKCATFFAEGKRVNEDMVLNLIHAEKVN
jgi:transposase-like protein